MKFKPSWRNLFLIFPYLVIGAILKRLRLTAEVKDGKLRVERGLLAKDISEIEIENITDIQINKSILQRLLMLGNLGIATSGTAGHEVVIGGIGSPMKVKEKIINSK